MPPLRRPRSAIIVLEKPRLLYQVCSVLAGPAPDRQAIVSAQRWRGMDQQLGVRLWYRQ